MKTDKWNLPSLEQYVEKCTSKNECDLTNTGVKWLQASAKNKIDYELEWFGIPVIQTAEDLLLMQELIFNIKPDIIIETGIAHGGSLIFYASLFELIGKGNVIGVDIDIRPHNKKVIERHPFFKRITLIEGDSTSNKVIDQINAQLSDNLTIIVCLDSNHYKDHVLKELLLYRQFVCVDSYIVVFDTITSLMAESGVCDEQYKNNGPIEAVYEFLKLDNNFVIDKAFNKLFISTSTNGYLKKISDNY